jgi:hypothetical protein
MKKRGEKGISIPKISAKRRKRVSCFFIIMKKHSRRVLKRS